MFEVVAGIVDSCPVEAKPANVLLDGVYVFGVFFYGVGVVEAQVCFSAVFLSEAEIKADRFGVANVEVAVGFWREARQDGFVRAVF